MSRRQELLMEEIVLFLHSLMMIVVASSIGILLAWTNDGWTRLLLIFTTVASILYQLHWNTNRIKEFATLLTKEPRS